VYFPSSPDSTWWSCATSRFEEHNMSQVARCLLFFKHHNRNGSASAQKSSCIEHHIYCSCHEAAKNITFTEAGMKLSRASHVQQLP
jgi:hypothetical protein